MAGMDLDVVMNDLDRRFAAPLPEFYHRRIIFWHDEDREFTDLVPELHLENAKVLILTGSNNFTAKKLLAVDDSESNYLIYDPFTYEKKDDNWLRDVELYSEEFRADLISIWMEEMGLAQTPAIRAQVKEFRKFFGAKTRREKTARFGKGEKEANKLRLAIMASLSDIDTSDGGSVIRRMLSAGLDRDTNYLYAEFCNYGADKVFWDLAADAAGYREENPSLLRFAAHFLLTAACKALPTEITGPCRSFISEPYQGRCYEIAAAWAAKDPDSLASVASRVEDFIKLPSRLAKCLAVDLLGADFFPSINMAILQKLMAEISDHIIDSDAIIAATQKRRTMAWYGETKNYYEGLLRVASMQAFFKEHAIGFHAVEGKQAWEDYAREYWVMDRYYREFHVCYQNSLQDYHADLHDLWKQVADKVEGLYSGWFLSELSRNWTACCEEELKNTGRIEGIMDQESFYARKVMGSGSRSIVIISDALRYEVAATLTEQLRRETQSKVELTTMHAIFPTITKFGMAALLPHRKLTAEIVSTAKTERLAVLADGRSTEAGSRDKVLKAADPKSVALRYSDLIAMKRADRQQLVKGMNVVYIYHDRIDEAGHGDGSNVFPACETAMEEIKNMIKVCVNDFGAARIMVTADHGFLYTHMPLREEAKVDKTTDSSMDVEYGRRYAIMQPGASPGYLMPVRFLDGSGFEAFTPRENIRIKMKGGAMNFVHGGASLQEMMVPVIEYHFLRNDSKEYQRNKSKYDTKPVTVSLLSASRKVSNLIFALNFFQTEAVADNRRAETYTLYFTDPDGSVISDRQKIIADKTDENPQDRVFRCSFNLKSMSYQRTKTYHLIIENSDGVQIESLDFQIDIAFAVDSFGFFD